MQVKREAHASKRARVSAKLDLAGTYMTVRPYGSGVAVSRRIRDEAERGRLARWARSSGGRVLVRTAAQGVADGRLQEERDRLARRVARLTRAARSGTAPGLLEAGPGVLRRLVRDYAARGLSRVVVETDADETAAADLLSDRGLLERHDGPGALVHSAGIWDATQRALEPRVELASGASLTVEPTQAFWAIDVDAGRVRRTGDVPAASAINLEAADRIGAEIRLRDLAGTIVIDFLSAAGDGEREEVVGRLRRSLRADRRYLRIAGWTRLGLCEVARRREGRSLLERLGPPDRPTPWARAARVLADAAKEPASRQPRRVTADRATARALRASIEAAEGSFEPRLEIEETG